MDPSNERPPYERPSATRRVPIRRVPGNATAPERWDEVASEEPLEIRIAGPGGEPATAVAVTMRTPGHDFELAAGFVLSEGIARGPRDLRGIRYCTPPAEEQWFNVVTVDLARAFDPERFRRAIYVSSSCGLCGRTSLDRVQRLGIERPPSGLCVPASVLRGLPRELFRQQATFARTGGVHATGVADAATGRLEWVREDVGRHNAFDKALGRLALDGRLPASRSIAVVSGRASFELVQKALVGGFPILASVGAPSHLAIALAQEHGLTLVGFLRDDGFNIYAGGERVARPTVADATGASGP